MHAMRELEDESLTAATASDDNGTDNNQVTEEEATSHALFIYLVPLGYPHPLRRYRYIF
jgi:hypothetical protein